MGWREDLKLSDIDDATEIEVECRKCGKHRYYWPRELRAMGRMQHLFMSEVQAALPCLDKTCDGKVRVQLMHDHLNQGFVAGMP